MLKFIERLNQIHESIKNGNRERLPAEVITIDFLEENNIIKTIDEKIVFLDTELIGENYLMLWNQDLILCLEDLEQLILSNLELRELELTTLKKLKHINLKSCKRDSLLYIVENQNLEELVTSELKLNGDDVCPVSLYAHPNQVGKVFSKNIEQENKTDEGYLVVNLHLAPPKLDTVQSNDFSLKFLSRFKEAELGVILKEYWNHQPEYYTKYQSIEDAANHEIEVFSVLLEVEKKVADDFYINKNVPFDPSNDIKYPSLSEREFSEIRKIPDAMTQTV